MLLKLNPNQNPIPVSVPDGGAGSPYLAVVSITRDATAAYGTVVAATPTERAINVTLPAASAASPTTVGNFVWVKNNSDSTQNVVIAPAGGDTIDGGVSFTLAAREYVILISDGVSEWLSF